jgi:large subunit ribosomal protein L10
MGSKDEKAKVIEQLKEEITKSTVAIVTDYRGLTVGEITTLRRGLQEKNAEYSVIKNTLAKLAVKGTSYEPLSQFFVGPTAIVLGSDDLAGPAKVLTQFMKKAKKVTVKGGLLEGNVLDEAAVKQLAEMPTIDELRSKIMGSINAPTIGILNCVNGVARALVVCIDQVRQQKESQ